MRDRCDYSDRSGFCGLRGRHFARWFSWSFSGGKVHGLRLTGRRGDGGSPCCRASWAGRFATEARVRLLPSYGIAGPEQSGPFSFEGKRDDGTVARS